MGRGVFMGLAVPQWIDIGQTCVMAGMAVALIVIVWAIRGEMRRSQGVMQAMSKAIGEQSDIARRLEQVESDIESLVLDIDRLKGADARNH